MEQTHVDQIVAASLAAAMLQKRSTKPEWNDEQLAAYAVQLHHAVLIAMAKKRPAGS